MVLVEIVAVDLDDESSRFQAFDVQLNWKSASLLCAVCVRAFVYSGTPPCRHLDYADTY